MTAQRAGSNVATPATGGSPNDWLTSVEAAKYTGLSEGFIRQLVATRQIRHARFGPQTIRFRRAWLDDFIASQTVEPETFEPPNASTRLTRH
jgi:excisionase family DNA binding protein